MATQRRRRRNIPVSVNVAVDDVTLTKAVKAVGTLTVTVNPSNAETVTIGSRVYTFQSTLTNVDGNVKIAGTLAATLTNLKNAILASGGVAGTDYAAATTAHPTVIATTLTGTTLQVDAQTAGVAGNAIATTETCANGSWGAGTLAGGVDGQVAAATYSVTTQNGVVRTSGIPGTWSSSDPTKATVNASGAVTASTGTGSTDINFTTSAPSNGVASVTDGTPTSVAVA